MTYIDQYVFNRSPFLLSDRHDGLQNRYGNLDGFPGKVLSFKYRRLDQADQSATGSNPVAASNEIKGLDHSV